MYYVIAWQWSTNRQTSEEYIAGRFDDYMNALLFQKAYSRKYSTNPRIMSESDFLKTKVNYDLEF